MKNVWILVVIVAVVVGGAAFFGGMKYASGKSSNSQMSQQRFGQFGQMGGNGGNINRGQGKNGGMNGGFVNGDILSKDAQSITLKMRDGGSKIIFLSSGTEISKFVAGTVDDLVVGKTVMINGAANADGSIVAKTVQLRSGDTSNPGAGNIPMGVPASNAPVAPVPAK